MKPTSATVLDREFLTMRCKLLDLAAAFDRIARDSHTPSNDPRLTQIRQAASILASDESAKAEKIQLRFSLPYDEKWRE